MSLEIGSELADTSAIRQRRALYNAYIANTSATSNLKLKQQTTDTFVSSLTGSVGSGNTCTDGDDNGKIGFLGVIGNITQGAVRTVPNMIKGMFTDKNGDFSLLQTAKTAAMGAVCIAFPAVGLAACGVGAVLGGAKVLTNVGKALAADTDAEAKAAWENVGSGGVTVGLSVMGAKASYSAMEVSAAGESGVSAMSQLKGDTFFKKLSEEGLVETAKALGKDAVSSTTNNYGKIKTNVGEFISNKQKINSDVKELSELQKAKNNAIKKQNTGETLTPEEQAAIDKWDNLTAEDYSKEAYLKLQKSNEKAAINDELSELNLKLKAARKSGDKEAIKIAQENIKSYINENTVVGKIKTTATGAKTQAAKIIKSIRENKFDLAELRTKLSKENLSELATSLGKNGKTIIKDIMSKNLPDLIDDYGYGNLGEIIATLSGTYATDNYI